MTITVSLPANNQASVNVFEEAARAKKVRAFTEYFDHWLSELGLDTDKEAAAMVEALGHMLPSAWRQHAIACGQREPSSETRAAIIEIYVAREASRLLNRIASRSGTVG